MNREIAQIFENIADMLQLKGENIHRYLSYRRAAETIRDLPRDLRAISAEGGLTDLPNIGKTLADKINEYIETGKLEFYERLKAEIPESLLDIMRINGVGPKKAKLFWDELGITTVAELQAAAENNQLAGLKGMGSKSQQKILDGIQALSRQTGRTPLGKALPAAQAILDILLAMPQVIKGEIAGSIRRARPTIGDVDILVAVQDMSDSAPIMQTFVSMENVARILGQGETKSSVELVNGLQVDVRVLPLARWGTGLQYFTGSQAHNVKIRQIALNQGYSLNEHALSPVDSNGDIIPDTSKLTFETEESLYEQLGLSWIPPELREDMGEIEAAQTHSLPHLITLDDIQGDLHMHTTWSDGKLSVREMAEAAYQRGCKYIVITDHSRSLGIANGLSIERLLAQQEEVRRVDAEMNGKIRVFHGTEMDINADGGLDFPDEILEQLDFVIASLHVSLRQDEEQITRRLLNAIQNPHVDLIGHPRAQQIPHREPVKADMDAIFAAAKQHNTALEINANPIRLDLEANYARRAIEMGILLAINTDAHQAEQLDLMHYGIRTARRGWVTPDMVINTWDVARFQAWITDQT
ncbi:MAG: DNA polymerase/3'-5' exonuclease PolX [Phototrophicales bacterium]|nr:MAG: DNA polymerase/3'-5' exonuclease PolX [Phototrophicales bacterium]